MPAKDAATERPAGLRWPKRLRAGLDLGSRVMKVVLAGPEGVVASRAEDSVPFLLGVSRRGGCDLADLGIPPQTPLVATGYGRALLPGLTGISEVRAHFLGALAQTGLADFTLVELGGQDSKLIQVAGGRPLDFITNDRCAAGTGRYLENMARLLEVPLERLGAARENPVEITNTCATFGETEVLGRLLEGASREAILAGINLSVARRVAQMVRRHRSPRIVLAGGVALNQAVVAFCGQATGVPVVVPPLPQFNGALGCCFEGDE